MKRILGGGRYICSLGVLLFLLPYSRGAAADGMSADQFSWSDLRHPKEKVLEAAFCNANSPLAKQLTQRLGSLSSSNSKLTGTALAAEQRRFEIGVAMAICHGGFRVAGTLYARMSQRDQDARQKALDDALAHDSQDKTTTYVLPDHPEITGTITPVSTITADNGRECTVLQDGVAEGSQNDSALNKFCRTPPETSWQRQTAI